MRLPETRDIIVRRMEFPVSCEEAKEEIGDVVIESPSGYEETVSDALERCGGDSFETADELYDMMVSGLSEEFVGRKGYDDRGPNPMDDREVSF
jgi:hypothetical protein